MPKTATKPKPARTGMSNVDVAAAKALGRCTFIPASYDKRFAREIARLAGEAEAGRNYGLTTRQRQALWSRVWRYRRQIADHRLIELAERIRKTRERYPAARIHVAHIPETDHFAAHYGLGGFRSTNRCPLAAAATACRWARIYRLHTSTDITPYSADTAQETTR